MGYTKNLIFVFMRFKILFIFPFFLALGMGLSHAQVRKSVKSARFKVPHISKSKARIVCPIFENSEYPYQGIGVKMGDPFAVTYKYYPNKKWAFTADVGRAASGLYSKYYRSLFNNTPDSLDVDQRVTYLGHTVSTDWTFQAKFLRQWDATKISRGLQFYAGLGWQFRSTTIVYDFLFEDNALGSVNPSEFGKQEEDRFTYGPVIITGFEYSYFSLPISAFIEIEWFTDTLLDTGYQRFQGGVGLRYIISGR